MIQEYKPFELTPTLLSIIVVFLIIIALFSTYAIKVRKLKDNIAPKGFVLIMQMYFTMIDNLVKQIIGRSSKNITPYIIFLMTYLIVANTIGIFGLENPTGSITLNISLAFITFLGTFAVGVKYHKLSYFKKFFFNAKIKGKKIPLMINPLSILSAFTPIISLSFRLWGNLLAGSIIITMWYSLTSLINGYIPFIASLNLVGAFTLFPFNAYFDIFAGVIQAYIFCTLTLAYWYLAKGEENIVKQEDNITEINYGFVPSANELTNK